MNPARAHPLAVREARRGPVVYWMSREQRVRDNWALLHAQELAVERHQPLAVVFALAPAFLGATLRQYDFLLQGLREVEATLAERRIPFFLLRGEPPPAVADFVARQRCGMLVTDFDPLRIKRSWQRELVERTDLPVIEVDAHNVVPCRVASDKREFAARTLRPKLHRLLPLFLDDVPELAPHPVPWPGPVTPVAWQEVRASLTVDRSVAAVTWLAPGEAAARAALERFLDERLDRYDMARNDPSAAGQSDLSPYLHFGQLAPQRVALAVARRGEGASRDAFLEELVVRRELADNFCWHTPGYDAVAGFPEWARRTLEKHRSDPRPYCYSREQLERAESHDPLWNAAQQEMLARGKMHGYLRMYWAKKILEWSPTPEEALATAIYLNDRYELDGRDPSGYTGIAWSIGGVHDRPWGERPVFGTVRYMSFNGCRRKFDLAAYVARQEKETV